MIERRAIGQLARAPLYNTRAVVQMSGVPADTFRAWERRYGLPRPYRTSSNQRLYSERDIGVIMWLRDRTDEGMTISQAIQRLRIEHPEAFQQNHETEPAPTSPETVTEPQVARLRERLIAAVAEFDDKTSEQLIDEGLALFSVEEFCTRVIAPTLVEIGERWARNELTVAVEHFATRIFLRRLSPIFDMVSPPAGRGTIVAACAPGEEHEIGLLILAIFLSRRHWRVVYLGANVPVDDLIETVRHVEPDLVCVSASSDRAAQEAIDVTHAIRTHLSPSPPVALGGRVFTEKPWREMNSGAHVLTGAPVEVSEQIAELIDPHRPGRVNGKLPA